MRWDSKLLTSSESKGSLVMLKSSYNIWNWSIYFCCIFIRAFSSFDSTAARMKKMSRLKHLDNWRYWYTKERSLKVHSFSAPIIDEIDYSKDVLCCLLEFSFSFFLVWNKEPLGFSAILPELMRTIFFTWRIGPNEILTECGGFNFPRKLEVSEIDEADFCTYLPHQI